MKNQGVLLTILLIITCITSVIFIYESHHTVREAETRTELVKDSYLLEKTFESVLKATLEMEAGLRGYVITGNEDVFANFQTAKQNLEVHLSECERLTSSDPTQKQNLSELSQLLDERKKLIQAMLKDKMENTISMVKLRLQIEEADGVMDDLRVVLRKMKSYERGNLERKERELASAIDNSEIVITIFGILPIIVGVGGYLLVLRENNRKRRAEEEQQVTLEHLQISEARYRNLNESSLDAICIADENGQIISWNKSAETMFGYTREEILGKSITEIMPERYRQGHSSGMQRFKDTKISKHIGTILELEGLRKNGKVFPIELLLSHWNTNDTDFFSASIRDITVTRQQRDELNKLLLELERSNEDLQQFAYVASHDLQEPLRKIRAFGDRLNQVYGNDPDNMGEVYIERMQDGAARMQTLIQDLLAFSRVSRGTGDKTEVDLKEVMSEVCLDLELRINETEAIIELGELPVIRQANPTQMRQLFLNLMSNALKFKKSDTIPKITINSDIVLGSQLDEELEGINERKKYHLITFQDNGIGFDQQYLDKIFTIFQRLHGRSKYEGTGIGLAVCKKICENHGGQLHAIGKLGVGAKFIVVLPF